MRIVRYDCGCVGMVPNDEGFADLLFTCDSDESGPCYHRDMSGKPHQPATEEYGKKLMEHISNSLIAQQLQEALLAFNTIKIRR